MIHAAIRKYYEEHTTNKADENGVLKIDGSFDGT